MITNIIAMAICILFSAYFSATETAFSSLNKTRLKAMAEAGDRKAQLALTLTEKYDRLISTILIGNNIVNIAVASIGTLVFTQLLRDSNLGATVSTIVVTIVVLIFGEITPKSIAKDYPEKFAMFSAPFIRLLIWILTPLNFIFYLWKKLISKLIKSDNDNKMSQEELLLLLDEVQQEGGIDESESELLKNAVEFGDLEAQDILTHRVDLEGVSVDSSKSEIARQFTRTRFSRLLVYEDSIDKIVGVIHQKDFYEGTGMTKKDINEIISPAIFVHQTEKIDNLLQLLQSEKSHVAVVVDEYGVTLGIVTMEDILEELVGDIWDEHDEVEEAFEKVDDTTYIVDCMVTLDDFCDFFNVSSDSDSISLGGWVMDQLECIPDGGEQFQYQNLSITVLSTDEHRVEKVKVIINETETEKE